MLACSLGGGTLPHVLIPQEGPHRYWIDAIAVSSDCGLKKHLLFFLLINYLFYVCKCFACMYNVCMVVCTCLVPTEARRVTDGYELLTMVTTAINHWSISPVPSASIR